MYQINKEKAKEIMLKEKYSPVDIDLLLKDFPGLFEPLGDAVDSWVSFQEALDNPEFGSDLRSKAKPRDFYKLTAAEILNLVLDPSISEEKRGEFSESLVGFQNALDLEIFGHSIRGVMASHTYHFLVAVRTLNRLLDPDLSEERRLELQKSLSHNVFYE